MFALPGVPLIFYGQEAGNKHELFELPSFDPKKKMSSFKPELWKFYKNLIQLRRSSPALYSGALNGLTRPTRTTVSFFRKTENETAKIDVDFLNQKVFLDGKEF